MRAILPLAAFYACVLSDDLKGTCVDGTDPMGVEQTCYGRCHIYESGPGWYGACDSYKVQSVDVTGPCGDSPQTACLSTFNAGWDSLKTNCGNCYYVEMKYQDGVVTSTYLKTMDTNGSETKFEMNGPAWVNLCPFVCAGSGDCSHDVASCPDGIIAQSASYPGPISGTNQRSMITFKRVDCNGSVTPQSTTPVPASPATTLSRAASTMPARTTKPTQSAVVTTPPPSPVVDRTTRTIPTRTTHPARPSPIPTPPPSSILHSTTRASPSLRPTTTTKPETPLSEAITSCQASLGYPADPSWSNECKCLCKYFGESDALCPARDSSEGVIACVMSAAPYCQRVSDDDSTGEETSAIYIKNCAASIGHATNPSWSSGCKDLCAYYGENAAFCPSLHSTEDLISCVMSAAPYCQRLSGDGSSGEDQTAAYIEGCVASIGHATNSSWSSGCKNLCAYYGGNAAFCPGLKSAEDLILCVMSAASYCERM